MDKLTVSKKSLLRTNNYNVSLKGKRVYKKDKCHCPAVNKKYKETKKSKARVKKVARNVSLLNEWAENEASIGEISEKPRISHNLKRASSSDSVIFVGTCSPQYPQIQNLPVIDLTESSDDISNEHNCKTLRTIYFPSRNFERNISLRESLATTSLINLPVIRRQKPQRRLNSATIIRPKNYEKLSVLNIPEKYLDQSDISLTDVSFLEKSDLTESDHKMINWIIEQQGNVEFSLSPGSSGYESSLDTSLSVEDMMKVYGITSKDNFY